MSGGAHLRRPSTVSTRVLKKPRHGANQLELDQLAVEEPLEMAARIGEATVPLGVTLRTPGDDEALLVGHLLSEGIIREPDQVLSLRRETEDDATLPASRIVARLREDANLDPDRARRAFPISAACGACGKSALAALKVFRDGPLPFAERPVAETTLIDLPRALSESQLIFASTGGLHAAARFDLDGQPLDAAEDIGRHNALDKLIGKVAAKGEADWTERVLLLSGRVGFDLIQKSLVAGCPFVASIGAPSSLAVELATLFRMTLVGFLRDGRFNVYSEPSRIEFAK